MGLYEYIFRRVDSIQSVKTVYGGVCQTDRPVVKLETMDSKGVMDTLEGQYGDQGSVPSCFYEWT